MTSPFPSYNHLYHISMLSLCDLHFIISVSILSSSSLSHLHFISVLSPSYIYVWSPSYLYLTVIISISSPSYSIRFPSYHICVWSPSEMTWGRERGVGRGVGGRWIPPAAGAHSAGRWAQRPCPSAARPSRTWTCHQSKCSAKCTRLNHILTWGGVGWGSDLVIIAVVSIALYLTTDKGEHTALYKINNNVYIKTSKIINYIVIIINIVFLVHTHRYT